MSLKSKSLTMTAHAHTHAEGSTCSCEPQTGGPTAIDPVCGMDVSTEGAKHTALRLRAARMD